MSATLYRTRDMHAAMIALAKDCRRTLAMCGYRSDKPIRFRPRKISYLKPLRSNSKSLPRIAAQWQKDGGILLHMHYIPASFAIPKHDALLLPECPLSVRELESYSRATTDVICIYQPPTWLEHAVMVESRRPSAEHAKKFVDSLSDDELYEINLHSSGMRGALGLADRFEIVYCIVPRIAPTRKELKEVWQQIMALDDHDGLRVWEQPGWSDRRAMRAMMRYGNIAPNAGFCRYRLKGFVPDYDDVRMRHQRAQRELAEIIALVEAAPELQT